MSSHGASRAPAAAACAAGLLVTIGLFPVAGPTERPDPTQAGAQGEIIEYEIASVPVIHRVNQGSEIVAVRLYLLGGAQQITRETAGIEALLLRAAALEHGAAIRRTGCREVLSATHDWTEVGFTGLRADLDSMWIAFTRQLTRPSFSQESLERARGELLLSARRRYSEPDLRVRALAWQGLFEGHPYEFDPLGTEESLGSLSHVDLERYWDEEFLASRMRLVVVGDVAQTQIQELMAPALQRLPPGSYRWKFPRPVERKEPHWLIEQRELPTNYVLGYFTGPSPRHEDYLPFRAAMAHLSSEIAYRVRQRQSMSYAAYAPFQLGGVTVGGVYASSSEPGETVGIMRYTTARIGNIRYFGKQWRRFLDQFTLGQQLEQMTSDGQAESLARAWLYFGDLTMANEFVERLRKVSITTAHRVLDEYMVGIQYGYLGDTLAMGDWW